MTRRVPNGEFSDRAIVITGGASGIGLETGKRFQRLGARKVLLIDWDWSDSELTDDFDRQEPSDGRGEGQQPDDGRTVRRMIRLQADVGRPADVERLFNGDHDSVQFHSDDRVDVLVNAAGENLACDIMDVSSEQWDRAFATNLKSAFLMTRQVIPMMSVRGGSIINVSSTASLLPRTNDPVYGVSKAALNDFTRRTALRRAENGIRVNAVCPGPVSNTRIQRANGRAAEDPAELERLLIQAMPIGTFHRRMVTPAEVAELIVYLSSDMSQMITGAVIPVDGGKALGIPPCLLTNRVG